MPEVEVGSYRLVEQMNTLVVGIGRALLVAFVKTKCGLIT